MSLEESLYVVAPARLESRNDSQKAIDESVDLLIHQKSKLLSTKLEVLAEQIVDRVRIRGANHGHILYDELAMRTKLMEFDPHYGGCEYDPNLRSSLYGRIFDLNKESRQEDVQCWKDIVLVMRDFLIAWESHEQSRTRAIFLKND